MEYFCNCNNVDGTDADGNPISWEERFNEFKKEFWFKLGNSMWWKHQSTFLFHTKYIQNEIMKHQDRVSGYSIKELDDVKILWYDSKIYTYRKVCVEVC